MKKFSYYMMLSSGFFVISLLFGRHRSAVYTSYQRVAKNKQTQKKGQEQPLGFAINVLIVG